MTNRRAHRGAAWAAAVVGFMAIMYWALTSGALLAFTGAVGQWLVSVAMD